MDRLDEALYILGNEEAGKAALDEQKTAVLAMAMRGKKAISPQLFYRCAIAATLVIGLMAGVLIQRSGLLSSLRSEPYVYLYGGSIPKTDAEEPTPAGQTVRPLEWSEGISDDIRIDGLPASSDSRAFCLTYLPKGMTAHWDHNAGLLEVADKEHARSILGMFSLRHGLADEEYVGLTEGRGRAKVMTSEFGETGGITWVLRLNQDVYFYISTEGLTYEEAERFVLGIQGQEGG